MRLVGIPEASEKWGVSTFTTRRLIDAGYVRSVTISSRRLIAEDEVERVTREGAGKSRQRKRVSDSTPSSSEQVTTRRKAPAGTAEHVEKRDLAERGQGE